MNTQLLFGVAVVPAIIGLTQLCKEIGIPSRFAPLVAVVFGVLAALAQVYAGQWPWIPAIVLGVSLGLSAVGLYSTTVTLSTPKVADQTTPTEPTRTFTQTFVPPTVAAAPVAQPSEPPISSTGVSLH